MEAKCTNTPIAYTAQQKRGKISMATKKPYVNKTLRSVIMKPSQLKNKTLKFKSKNYVTEYKKQCHIVVKLNKSFFFNKHAKGDADILLFENK